MNTGLISIYFKGMSIFLKSTSPFISYCKITTYIYTFRISSIIHNFFVGCPQISAKYELSFTFQPTCILIPLWITDFLVDNEMWQFNYFL